ncbi:phosphoglycerol transferase MdoB-like AlkP superfamily enzyme [Lachnospiraceae bacterium PF1-21]|uniref:LTA synthase family protein n=1 Tax=Ohessyouella blattaphilus TaxID=2949333 RepID=UPI003E25DBC2
MKKFNLKKFNLKDFSLADLKEWFRKREIRRAEILEKRRNSEWAKKMAPVYTFLNRYSLLFHIVLAIVINLVIEALSRHSLFKAIGFLAGSPLVFLYNAFMIFCTLSIVYAFRRRTFARIIITVLWFVLGVANGYMLLKRVTPFNAQDLTNAKDGLSLITNYFSGFEIVVLAVGLVALVLWVVSMYKRGAQFQGRMHRVVALIGTGIFFGIFFLVSSLAVEKRVISTYFGNIAFAYEDYGLPYCFMTSVFNTGINQPNGYDEEAMAKINENDELTKSETGRATESRPNILVVQLESFFDVNEVEFFDTNVDALPNLRSMFENYSSGYFKVPSIGAGTANTEFEVLTGMNLRYFGPGEYPYKTYSKEKPTESAATALASLGYSTHALHNNGGNFYSRAKVFDNMGFDSFTSKEFMNILQTTPNGWSKDDILVQHMMDAMDTSEGTDFVFTISVQGHGDYPEEKVIENPVVEVTGIEDEALKNKWEYYVNMVYEMDQFVGRLRDAVEKRGEPTVIVFYGDHLPTLGLESEDLHSRYLYNTNYVIWDNIGLPKEDENVTSYQLLADLFNRLDIHSGTVFNYHQQRRKTSKYLEDLELLQYDILYGKQYVYDGDPPITEGHMMMGVKDVTLSNVIEVPEKGYSLYGTNFTKGSKVYVNGEKQKSTFLNNTHITLPETTLSDGDEIVIKQMGSSNTEFRRSNQYIYEDGALTEVPDTKTDLTTSWVHQQQEEE